MKQKDMSTLIRYAVRYAMGKNRLVEEEISRIVMDNKEVIDKTTATMLMQYIEMFLERVECESHDIWNIVYYDLESRLLE
mgnify:CR=1 FL=1